VSSVQGSLIVGEIRHNEPHRAKPYNLLSLDPTNNIIGRAFTHVLDDDENVREGANGGGAFAGILFSTKSYAINDGLSPSLVVPNYSVGSFITMGSVVVNLESITTGRIGEGIYYNDATGALSSGTAAGGQTQIVGAAISDNNLTGPGKAYITLTPGDAGSSGPVTGGNANIAKHFVTASEAASKVITFTGVSSLFSPNVTIDLRKLSSDLVTVNPLDIVSLVFGASDIVLTLYPGFTINENESLTLSEGVLA